MVHLPDIVIVHLQSASTDGRNNCLNKCTACTDSTSLVISPGILLIIETFVMKRLDFNFSRLYEEYLRVETIRREDESVGQFLLLLSLTGVKCLSSKTAVYATVPPLTRSGLSYGSFH